MNSRDVPYRTRQSRMYGHLAWYIRQSYKNSCPETQPLSDIQEALAKLSGIKPRKETILKYNAHQFALHQTAPLENVGGGMYQLNENYYRQLGERVFGPRMGRLGRPKKKYTQGDEVLDAKG